MSSRRASLSCRTSGTVDRGRGSVHQGPADRAPPKPLEGPGCSTRHGRQKPRPGAEAASEPRAAPQAPSACAFGTLSADVRGLGPGPLSKDSPGWGAAGPEAKTLLHRRELPVTQKDNQDTEPQRLDTAVLRGPKGPRDPRPHLLWAWALRSQVLATLLAVLTLQPGTPGPGPRGVAGVKSVALQGRAGSGGWGNPQSCQ